MRTTLESPSAPYFLTFTSVIACVVILGLPAVVKAQAEESTTTQVPDVVDMGQEDAQSEIMEAGLTVGTITPASSDMVSPGDVMDQNPAAETSVPSGTPVNLVISAGPAVSVPNVVGMSQSDAQAAILSAGLVVGMVTPTGSATVSAGNVIGQSPKAKASVTQGSSVILILSSGPP